MTPEEWGKFVQSYDGRPEDFGTWAWKTLKIPEEMLYIAPYEPPPRQANGDFLCNYHGCVKEYTSKQGRENHFNVAHLGFRVRCPDCPAVLKNQNSLSRHRQNNCTMRNDLPLSARALQSTS
ncbi:hypothetical protein BT96DRAFT_993031 [Gymnopus androsaceus JB14]|uniref:C2H2-type domain-containing protein n=1 Tax=Gymnopus androsaceus JB14 TaxID=1447944 RepID=A0A6A4HQR6_9AGAR|nr:hypothetical protein BT96DRAFT_1009007 [Gymnopus androsaceus JB14]KAE9400333.1 hypothetical protein BT96DRAFT_993031 [Gymnopus androsaceus JB14]